MYCPKCGQQQVSDDMRFCSRCGLPIAGLAEWLADGAALAVRREATPSALASPRRKGIRRGAKLMFLSGILLPIFFGFSILVDGPFPLIIPFTVFFTGLSLMLYARIFGEETPPAESQKAQPSRFASASESNALPPASNSRINGLSEQRVRTSELAQPPSVTENTTRLLDNE
jgi:endogenous inhibitor of DNA gyrase (YacG/DUF329 family)